MKKTAITFIATLALIITLFIPGSALAANQPNYASMSSDQIAYCDLKTAPQEWQEPISAARKKIIYSKSWTVNGQVGLRDAHGNVIPLPEFSALFPTDWEVPSNNTLIAETPIENAQTNTTILSSYFSGYVPLYNPTQYISPAFASFFASQSDHDNYVTTIATYLPGSSCNIGYYDWTAGYDVGYATYVPVSSDVVLISPIVGHEYYVRASTYSTTGSGYFYVGPMG